MGYLFQINKMLVEIKKNTSEDIGANKILVEDCIERTPHIGEDSSFDMILFFCKELSIIKEKDSRLTGTEIYISMMYIITKIRRSIHQNYYT